jgi:hypothetical protein
MFNPVNRISDEAMGSVVIDMHEPSENIYDLDNSL